MNLRLEGGGGGKCIWIFRPGKPRNKISPKNPGKLAKEGKEEEKRTVGVWHRAENIFETMCNFFVICRNPLASRNLIDLGTIVFELFENKNGIKNFHNNACCIIFAPK